MDVLGLINKQNSLTLEKCPRGYKCVEKARFGGGIIWGVVLSIKKSLDAFRCSFLGSLKTLESKRQQRPKQLSKLLDTLRPPLHTCQARKKNKNKKKKNSLVCCRDTRGTQGGDRLRTNDDLVLDDIGTDQYQYEDGGDYEYYEEEYDLNFDEVIIYSHRNAPGGR